MSATGRSPVRLDQDAYQTPVYCVDKLLSWLDLNGRDGEPLTFLRPTPGGCKERPLRDLGGHGLPGHDPFAIVAMVDRWNAGLVDDQPEEKR